ncbi:MAG: Scr1 family TA system antitoxin-like transcriptional regulator [Dehalococcoidia bacterium]
MRIVFGGDEGATAERLRRHEILTDESKRFVVVMTEGALRWHADSAQLMVEQLEAIITSAKRPTVRLGIIPWTTPVRVFPRHGFHIYDDDAVIVGTETATATMTGVGDVATYVELFAALNGVAVFGEKARQHLARIADDYRRLIP